MQVVRPLHSACGHGCPMTPMPHFDKLGARHAHEVVPAAQGQMKYVYGILYIMFYLELGAGHAHEVVPADKIQREREGEGER